MIEVPQALVDSHAAHGGAASRAFVEALPARAAALLDRWELRRSGAPMHGLVSLALPVERADGTESVLKIGPVDEETEGEPAALRTWDGAGAVRLLEHDPATGALLLEGLDAARPLSAVPDVRRAVQVVAELLARLSAGPAPAGMRRLGDVTAAMLAQVPAAARRLVDADERRLLLDCAAAVREVADEPGDRLLHWDLHYDNVLAAEREPWLAIDPKPLAGDPGFELLPALTNRYDPDPAATVWRFDLMTEVLGLDRERARAWTLARSLQWSLWDVAEDGKAELPQVPAEIALALLAARP
ncbi:aminoglycoside phosphotransferase family protein [Streptomyces sp. NPDC017979]|uniref:aminoglycoside phosphotransferase family protein n=1 Tax=Streptomyces sp. NPDC017979 TaxID=3365024 RepID=UPI0037B60709